MNFLLYSRACALLALGTGVFAAWKWYQASKVEVVPSWIEQGRIERPGGEIEGWVLGHMKASQKSAALNKVAAIWTGISVILGPLSRGAIQLVLS